jgi:hypothetical protein
LWDVKSRGLVKKAVMVVEELLASILRGEDTSYPKAAGTIFL